MSPEELDKAMCVYLGGPPDAGGIQIGRREERLVQTYPDDFATIKITLDQVLEAATQWAYARNADDANTIYSWLASELPSLSIVTRNKIAAHVIYNLEH
jgi:hypothetical protein